MSDPKISFAFAAMGGNKSTMLLQFACMLVLFLTVSGGSQASENSVNAAEDQMAASISNANFTFTNLGMIELNAAAETKEKEDLSDIFNGPVGGVGQDYHDFVGGQPTTPTDYYNYAGSPPEGDSNPPTDFFSHAGAPPANPTFPDWPDDDCTKDLDISQDATDPMPDGIPTYTVHVSNLCVDGNCCISDIHLSCGWYASARLVNPDILRRLDHDDCLLNSGKPMRQGESIFFTYANTHKYPMDISSTNCGC